MAAPLTGLSFADLDALVAISRGHNHGQAIVDDSRARSVEPLVKEGTVYGSLRRLRERQLIVECLDAAETGAQPRGKVLRYRVTAEGQALARAESERLSALLNQCRAVGF